jgi:predicted MFS family arabinose efflux permease
MSASLYFTLVSAHLMQYGVLTASSRSFGISLPHARHVVFIFAFSCNDEKD